MQLERIRIIKSGNFPAGLAVLRRKKIRKGGASGNKQKDRTASESPTASFGKGWGGNIKRVSS